MIKEVIELGRVENHIEGYGYMSGYLPKFLQELNVVKQVADLIYKKQKKYVSHNLTTEFIPNGQIYIPEIDKHLRIRRGTQIYKLEVYLQ